jgi:hypothetical protein
LGTHAKLLGKDVTTRVEGGRSLIKGGGDATGVVGLDGKLADV